MTTACAAPPGQQAKEDVGPVTAYARNSLAAENPAGLLRIGEGFERSGDYVGARKLYAQAMEAAPDLVEAKIAYARVSGKAGFGDEAVAELTLLLEQNPNDRKALLTLARVHSDAERYTSAYSVLQRLTDLGAAELALRGQVAHAVGRHEEGHAGLVAALDSAPGDPSILEAAALSFAIRGEYAGAVGLLRQAMDRPALGQNAQQSLALVYALSGQRQLALQLARDVVPPSEMQRIDLHFRLLPRLGLAEQAQVLFFDRIPKDTIERLSGRATN